MPARKPIVPLTIREFVHPAVVEESHQLFGFLRRRHHDHGLSPLDQRDKWKPATAWFPKRARADDPRAGLQALRGRPQREHFIDEAAEEGGVVALPPARPALMGDERGKLEGCALTVGLRSELFHSGAAGILATA